MSVKKPRGADQQTGIGRTARFASMVLVGSMIVTGVALVTLGCHRGAARAGEIGGRSPPYMATGQTRTMEPGWEPIWPLFMDHMPSAPGLEPSGH